MLFETIEAREACGRQESSVHAQMRIALGTCPVGQLGVHALAVHHQWGQQADMLALELAQQLGGDALGCLRFYGCAIVHAVLRAQLDIEQAQKMPDLGGRAHGGLAPAA